MAGLENVTENNMIILNGDSREILKTYNSQFDLIITSPPYADARVKHYGGVKPQDYPDWLSSFHESFWNSLKPNGSLIINIKDKVVNGVRNRYVWDTINKFSELGWLCIEDYIWYKSNSVPGYWPNRLSDAWEYCFHLTKCLKPFFNTEAVKKPIGEWATRKFKNIKPGKQVSATGSGFTRNLYSSINKDKVLPANVLHLPSESSNKNHPAVFPVTLPEFFIKLLSPENGIICDPFSGSGSTGVAALKLNRNFLLIDIKQEYCDIARNRMNHYLRSKHV